ncbi:MAG: class I SAM-dependent methyltransferase [Gemmatimonadota bacterium]
MASGMTAPRRCPLCHGRGTRSHALVQGRRYHACAECGLIHMDPADRLDPEAERSHYGHHENDPGDPRYRAFLDRLATPLAERLEPGARGLDFGSGPGPALSTMLEERGFVVSDYDPFFAPGAAVLRQTFDFVAATETVEHFFDPRREFDLLDRLLRPGGLLGIMTQWRPPARAFEQWRYARDPTHVSFYGSETMEWIGRRYGWDVENLPRDVTIFRKSKDSEKTDGTPQRQRREVRERS